METTRVDVPGLRQASGVAEVNEKPPILAILTFGVLVAAICPLVGGFEGIFIDQFQDWKCPFPPTVCGTGRGRASVMTMQAGMILSFLGGFTAYWVMLRTSGKIVIAVGSAFVLASLGPLILVAGCLLIGRR